MAFLAKYISDGDYFWAHGFGNDDTNVSNIGWGLAIDSIDGSVYLLGQVNDDLDLDPSAETGILSPDRNTDMFLAKYSNDGACQWAIHAGGNSQERGYFICTTLRGELIAMGYYDGTCDFDPSAEEQFKYNNGGHDIFLAWYQGYNTTGINDERSSDQVSVRIYPDPVRGILNIDSDEAIGRIEIFSITGSLIQSHVFHQNKAVIDLPELPQGTYMLRIYQDAGILYRKFVKVD